MRIRTILGLGCMVNLVLIAGIVVQGRKMSESVLNRTWQPSLAASTNEVREIPVAVAPSSPEAPVKENPPSFKWSDVESEDYFQLAVNLQGVGCPAQTVRDIVIARAGDDYADVLWDLQKMQQPQFWKKMATGDALPDWRFGTDEVEKRIKELTGERDELVGELYKILGRVKNPPRLGEQWSHLTVEDQKKLRMAKIEHADKLARLQSGPDAIEDKSERKKKRREFEKELRAKTKALVGEEGMDEFNLRGSRHAKWILNVIGLDISVAELRSVTVAREVVDLLVELPSGDDPEQVDLRRALRVERDQLRAQAVIEVLGTERAGGLARAADEDYETMRKVAWRHGLLMDVANRAHAVKEVAVSQAAELAAVPGLDDGLRAQAAAALLLNVREELSGIYGEGAYPTLEKYAMGWFDELFKDVKSAAGDTEAP